MRSLFRKIRSLKFSYKPLVYIEISKSRLIHNLRFFQNINKDVKVAPVLKSNAYGHSLEIVAKVLDKEQLPFVVVDSFYEAMILRNETIKTPILIIGYTYFENIISNKLKDVAFTITSLDQLEEISLNLAKKVYFHLKIDTGMGRQGIRPEYIDKAIKLIKANPNIVLEGVCSHLADAEVDNSEITKQQINLWNQTIGNIKNSFSNIKYFHLANSAGIINHPKIKQNVCRIGLGLYGIGHKDLKPVLSMKTIITSVKTIKTSDIVGYNGTYKSKASQKIATIPVGYYEGLNRKLSNSGLILV